MIQIPFKKRSKLYNERETNKVACFKALSESDKNTYGEESS